MDGVVFFQPNRPFVGELSLSVVSESKFLLTVFLGLKIIAPLSRLERLTWVQFSVLIMQQRSY